MRKQEIQEGTNQQKIYNWLKLNGPATSKEIYTALGLNPQITYQCARKLRISGLIGKQERKWTADSEHDAETLSVKVIEMIESGKYTRDEIAKSLNCSAEQVSSAVNVWRRQGLEIKLVYTLG